ncbi:hypothetical protein E2986_11478 [Frieseomelitta varia]|uniref:EGF-like domain-containing protein n=1 Tax=Frieseomelitta varia TaxID=561572 RepID=A0A833RY11_9HYME|nr:hypothetical protein E2986_11478 [Frieseomelitta varia]
MKDTNWRISKDSTILVEKENFHNTISLSFYDIETEKGNPCSPSPCGPNSVCREVNEQAVCTCVAGFLGSPPTCRPECTVSSDCPLTEACNNQKCINPCPGTCGFRATCNVVNHNPICSCPSELTGDPFVQCVPRPIEPVAPQNPCEPSPCGPNSECRVVNDAPSCSCSPEFIGAPPNCRPECVSNSECPSNMACVNQKCRDPCPGSCGANAECRVVSHTPTCVCPSDYTGDPFTQCTSRPCKNYEIFFDLTWTVPVNLSPCSPSPCGFNAICKEQNGVGSCTCLPDYIGNPYEGCRPECVIDTDCTSTFSCIRSKCQDPCPGTCGINTECRVINHRPVCTCIQGYSGNPFQYCIPTPIEDETKNKDPCNPSPCGPNSQCRVVNGQGVCSCLPEFTGTPPMCRPECTLNSECPQDRACINQKCVNPCPASCGTFANCAVRNHSPFCTCRELYTGDPFTRCFPTPQSTPPTAIEVSQPCLPSPCGPNSECRVVNGGPSCQCLPTYIGSPPNCRPECTVNSDCSPSQACMRGRCRDPCPGSCGSNAQCMVLNHVPICSCFEGYTGDPFSNCYSAPVRPTEPTVVDPCASSPCGPNARCNDGICTCLPEYQGDPYVGCRPECVLNTDCLQNRACIRNKCVDPCPGTCGVNAECLIYNHVPMCNCPNGMVGNAFVQCNIVEVNCWLHTSH